MRFLADHAEAMRLLQSEMGYGVVTAVEAQVIDGDGLGENLTGVLATTGVTNVAFATDVPTTARKARTALEVKDEVPSAWVFNPADAEALDLLRENGVLGTSSPWSASSARSRSWSPTPYLPARRSSETGRRPASTCARTAAWT